MYITLQEAAQYLLFHTTSNGTARSFLSIQLLSFSGKPLKYSRIDEPLYQLDEGNLWEYYRFKSITKSVRLATLIKNEFQWNTNKSKNLFERRGNFENITLFGMSGIWTTYNNLPNSFIKEDHISKTIPDTYEVMKLIF